MRCVMCVCVGGDVLRGIVVCVGVVCCGMLFFAVCSCDVLWYSMTWYTVVCCGMGWCIVLRWYMLICRVV